MRINDGERIDAVPHLSYQEGSVGVDFSGKDSGLRGEVVVETWPFEYPGNWICVQVQGDGPDRRYEAGWSMDADAARRLIDRLQAALAEAEGRSEG